MADSTCLMHGFSYASAIPNESKQGNPMHVLGESISFGRFITDSEPLSWSSFSSHKKYVEEARRYAQPGSVAQKKAFFEAHYKRIAAQKAAALLEQQNAAKIVEDSVPVPQLDECGNEYENCIKPSPVSEEKVSKEVEIGVIRPLIMDCVENQDTVSVSVSDGCGTPQTTEERPLLKQEVTSKKKSGLSTLKSTIQRKTWKVPTTPAKSITPFGNVTNLIQSTRKSNMEAMDKIRSSPKSLRQVMNSISIKSYDKEPVSATKKTARTPNNFKTPWKTPVRASSKHGAGTPMSDNRRKKTPIEPSTPGIKTTGPKWHILSAVCSKSLTSARKKLESPTVSTPFVLRTEERAAKRKQKLEEKFNANEVQKEKTLKEKAGKEFRKLSCSLCFKARPLPEFYSERGEASVTKMKKSGKTVTNKKLGNILMPSALQPKVENGVASKISLQKDDTKPSKSLPLSHPGRRIRSENISPNHSALSRDQA